MRVFQRFFMLPLIKYNPLHRTIFATAEKNRTGHDFVLFVFFFFFDREAYFKIQYTVDRSTLPTLSFFLLSINVFFHSLQNFRNIACPNGYILGISDDSIEID